MNHGLQFIIDTLPSQAREILTKSNGHKNNGQDETNIVT